VTDYLTLFMKDFDPEQGMMVQLFLPDGSSQEFPSDNNYLDIYFYVGFPRGVYDFIAVQGEFMEVGSFTLQPSSHPVIHADLDEPHDLVYIDLAGFQPSERVLLNIYRETNVSIWTNLETLYIREYVTTLGPFLTDKLGEYIVEIPIVAGDPPGDYVIFANTNLEINTWFGVAGDDKNIGTTFTGREICGKAVITNAGSSLIPLLSGSTVIANLRNGQRVDLLCYNSSFDESTQVAWTLIRSGIKAGWVDSRYLELIEGSIQIAPIPSP
jgi:hypothetical protein